MEDSNNFLENIGDIDGEQDIARSAYADMLHDIERNEKYEKAIAKVISQMKNKGVSVNVLDIGTGTGLLSMMAARHGADSIVACEAFTPVAECAVKVIEDNGYSASIKVIPKRSTDLILGNDLPKKANLVVAELYDTELIGEGAILSYNHARKELLEEDFLSVPSRARIYAQLVECPLARSWNRPFSIEVTKNDSIMPPPEAEICSGAPAVHDIQMSQLLSESFTAITDPAEVFCFDWLSPYTPSTGHNVTNLKTIAPGSVNAVFFWWTTDMDPEGEIILSCAPVWAHPDAKKGLLPWRDHWMQAVYYLPNDVCASEIGVELVLEAFHDEYSLWFRLGERHHNNSPIAVKETRPICNCFLHLAYSRPRLGLLNDKTRQNKYIDALKRYLFPGATVLSLGDGSWLSLIAAKLGATVIAIETNPMCRRVIESYSESNGLQNNLTILSGSIDKFSERSFDKKINFVIAEPFFEDSVLPWDHLYFWMEIKKIKSFLDPGMKVLPSRVKIKGLGVRFHDLHKIQTPIVETCGFSMKQFDDLIQEAIDSIDETIEPHPLWEYPCTALTDIVNILELSFALDDKSSHSNLTDVEVTATDEINGVVIWCEWFLDDNIVISTGPRSPTNKGEVIHWDLHSKQGCHFLRNINNINSWSRLQFLAMENDCEISIEINRI